MRVDTKNAVNGGYYCCKGCVGSQHGMKRTRKQHLARVQRRADSAAIVNGVLDWLEALSDGGARAAGM